MTTPREPVPATAPAAPRRAVGAGRRRPGPLVWTGLVALVVGLAAVGWAVWSVLRPPVDAALAAAEVAALRAAWAAAPSATAVPLPSGAPSSTASPLPTASASPAAAPSATSGAVADPSDEAMAVLVLEDLGAEIPVFAGTSDEVLGRGAGWYAGTAAPGQVGNAGFAALGSPRGPLAGLESLPAGARVLVETREAVFTYVLDNAPAASLVANTDFWVLDPVPGRPGERPTEARITITTAFDPWASPRRMVAWGHLVATEPRADAGAAPR